MALGFALRRLLAVIPTFILVSILIFALVRSLPGDPAQLMLGEAASPESIAQLRESLGLDQPLPVQYLKWFGNVLRGDFGISNSGVTVAQLFSHKVPITLELTLLSILVALVIAFVSGLLTSMFPDTWIDRLITFLSVVGIALPTFFTGILLIYAFSVNLRWFPSSGFVEFGQDPAANLRLMFLPAITLGVYSAAILTRYLRTSMLETLGQDYIRTGVSKGIGVMSKIFKHALRNAIIPVVTVLGLQIGVLLGGSVVTEQVFSIPGVGNMLVVAVLNRDLATIQATALITAIAVFVVNFLVDLAYAFIDPRIRF